LFINNSTNHLVNASGLHFGCRLPALSRRTGLRQSEHRNERYHEKLNVRKFRFQHGSHAGIASITPHLRAYRCGTRECYYILYLKAS